MASELYTAPRPVLFCPHCGGVPEWVTDWFAQQYQRCDCGWDNRPDFEVWLERVGPADEPGT